MRLASPKKKQVNTNLFVKALEISTQILPGESIGLDVSFTRADTATITDNLRITSDDPLGNEDVSIELTGHTVAPVLALSADTLDFGGISSESQLSVMVSNDGEDTLHVSTISLPSSAPSKTLLP